MRTISLGIAALVLLSGCSAGVENVAAPTTSPSATPTPSPTPTIDPGPVLMTEEEAAEYYLRLICQSNTAGQALNDAIIAGEEEWLNGGEPDPAAVKSAASTLLGLKRLAIEVMDDDYFTWPGEVGTHVGYIRESFIQESAVISAVANVSRYEDAYYSQFPEQTPEQAGAGQEIRYQLGIDADTTTSCVGYEAELEALHAEMIERNEYLAQFESSDQ